MQECTSCPTYQIHPIEFQNDEDSDKIKFQTWATFYKCSCHGPLKLDYKKCNLCEERKIKKGKEHAKLSFRKDYVIKCTTIREFMNTFWLPQLKKYAYYKSYADLLSKNGIGKDRNLLSSTDASSKYIQERRDYAEGLKEEPHFQVQSAHYGGGRICHIEGSLVDYKDKDGKKTSEFHSHFFDNDWKQAAYTTHQNNLVLLVGK